MSRYHDLDALRAFAMLLGLVLHGLLSFMPVPFWPAQDIRQEAAIFGAIVALIHGFRMQLFFLLSGFFMIMLWKKRGASGLIKNRALRILVPLITGTLMIIPLSIVINQFGTSKKDSIVVTNVETPNNPESIWEAARQGDVHLARRLLENGENPDGRDKTGISVLSWASMAGSGEIVSLLIQHGVDVNARDRENRTALHAAAFMGRERIVEQLIAARSEPNVTGANGDTPMDSASSDLKTLQWIAGMLKLEYDVNEVEKGRQLIKESLRKAGAKYGRELPIDLLAVWKKIAFSPVFHHLWFLNYLIWFTLAFLFLASFAKLTRLGALPGFFIKAPWCLVWLIPLTFAGQKMMKNPIGPDTAPGLFIWPPIFYYYGIFVLFGTLCFGREEFMKSSGSVWIIYLFLAALTGFAALAKPDVPWIPQTLLAPLYAATFAWLTCFGLIGAFRYFFSGERKSIRWLSDSAYWLYLTHLPLIMALQISVSHLEYPAPLKFLFVVTTTTLILLLIYQRFIRYTFIGTILNGKKIRPSSE